MLGDSKLFSIRGHALGRWFSQLFSKTLDHVVSWVISVKYGKKGLQGGTSGQKKNNAERKDIFQRVIRLSKIDTTSHYKRLQNISSIINAHCSIKDMPTWDADVHSASDQLVKDCTWKSVTRNGSNKSRKKKSQNLKLIQTIHVWIFKWIETWNHNLFSYVFLPFFTIFP